MIVIVLNPKMVEAIDNQVLLERRVPGFCNYLNRDRGSVFFIEKNLQDTCNLFVNGINPYYFDDIVDNNPDGSITFHNIDIDDDMWLTLTEDFFLNSGEYFISNGNKDMPFGYYYVYEAVQDGDDKLLCTSEGSPERFTVTDDKTEIMVGLCIRKNKYDEFTANPMITDISSEESDYQACKIHSYYGDMESVDKYMEFQIGGDTPVTERDVAYFGKSLSNGLYSGYSWITVYPHDYTVTKKGVYIKAAESLSSYGPINYMGRVNGNDDETVDKDEVLLMVMGEN